MRTVYEEEGGLGSDEGGPWGAGGGGKVEGGVGLPPLQQSLRLLPHRHRPQEPHLHRALPTIQLVPNDTSACCTVPQICRKFECCKMVASQ